MSTVENRVAAGSLEELAELIGLTNAHINMQNHFPKDVPPGKGCGVFFGLGGGVHVAVGSGKLVAIAPSHLHLEGKFEYLGHKGPADLNVELTGPGTARLKVAALSPGWMNAATWQQNGNLFYRLLDGPVKDATIKQIFANAGFFSGAYVEFHITLKDGKYYEVKYWFHKG